MKNNITTIAFDADDTLWINEPHFQEAEMRFCTLFDNRVASCEVSAELLRTEIKNLELYGYGIKGFILCMMETAQELSEEPDLTRITKQVLEIGHELLKKPVELLNGVEETLGKLKEGGYNLIMATKGDLLDQERKLEKSGLRDYFHHIEIMSDKKAGNYEKLLKQLNCSPQNFLMLGNSVKSDIVPVLELGGYAGHIPYEVTWSYEKVAEKLEHDRFLELKSVSEILNHLK